LMDDFKAADRFLKALWRKEVERLNDHLPREFKTLEELLKEEEPSVKAKDGSELVFSREELEFIAKSLPKDEYRTLRLPIILMRRIDLGPGVFSVSGGRAEALLVRKVLNEGGRADPSTPLYLYRPQVALLRRKLKTTTVIGFSTEGVLGLEELL